MRGIVVIAFLCFSYLLEGQEVISNLVSNPILKSEELSSQKNKSALTLPFIDDFSYNSSVVNPDLWEQSSVFVNRTYPINPITIGVATFDGLDEYGFARDFSPSNPSEPSDTLLSQAIDLGGQSSLYFMFYFQEKGIGDIPEMQDTLVLEFLNDTFNWEMIWFSNGQTMLDSVFEKVVHVIDEQKFMHSTFQFRFRNYATISGNFDHWHIDYVKLDELLSISDTTELNDVSFVYSAPSFLKRYEQMPWGHFKNNKMAEMNDTAAIFLRNNEASINVDYYYNIFENNTQIAHYPTLGVSRNESIFDFDSTSEITSGAFTFIETGTANSDSGWVLTTDGAVTVGSTALAFSQFSGAGSITAGTGLTKTGDTLSVDVTTIATRNFSTAMAAALG